MTMASLPLNGITVVALEHAVAAPIATRQLADLGATVIKIERPGVGDFARNYDSTVMGQSSFFVWANRGKQSLTLDIKKSEGLAVLHQLLGKADVFLQNLAPGATARLGLDFDTLHKQYKNLIVCDISGYGDSGPYKDKKAYDLLIQAASGLISVTGSEESPSRTGISIADISAGMYAYSGVLSAVIQRYKTNAGVRVEVTMLEALTEWMSYPLYFNHYGGTPPKRSGIFHPTIAPYGQYPIGDGSVMIFGLQNEREWKRFCQGVLLRPELIDDPRFNSNTQRVANRDVLDELIIDYFKGLNKAQVATLLDDSDIANSPLNGMDDVWDHPQFQARDRWRQVQTPAGAIAALLPPATISGCEMNMGDVPALGEQTVSILQGLGYTDAAIQALADAKVT
ncbi:CoA transferase [Alcaligenaceae bacterium]|nr:CoA transferase [Alcaligenaceae bacterium]